MVERILKRASFLPVRRQLLWGTRWLEFLYVLWYRLHRPGYTWVNRGFIRHGLGFRYIGKHLVGEKYHVWRESLTHPPND